MVDLVRTPLEGADSVADEDPKKVVRAQFVLQEIFQDVVHKLKFWEGVSRIILQA